MKTRYSQDNGKYERQSLKELLEDEYDDPIVRAFAPLCDTIIKLKPVTEEEENAPRISPSSDPS